MPVILLGMDGRIRHLNPAYERLLGRSVAALRGQPIDRVLPGGGRERRVLWVRGARLFAELIARGAGRAVFPNVGPDGSIVQVEVVAHLFRRREPGGSWVLAFVKDLGNELTRLDLRIAALEKLGASGDNLLEQLVHTARQLVGARYAAIELIEDGAIVHVVQEGLSEGQQQAIGGWPSGHGLIKAMLEASGPVRTRDVGSDRRAAGFPDGHPRISSFLGVPVESGGHRFGHLLFGDKLDLDEFTILDEKFAQLFAIQGAIALQDQRERAKMAATIEALRTSEHQLAAAQRLGHVGSWERDIESGVLTWSSEAHRVLGVAATDMPLTIEDFLAFVHPDDQAKAALAVAEMDMASPPAIDYRIIRADGSLRHVHEVSEVIRDAADRPLRFTGATQDVTEQVAAEGERARLASAVSQSHDAVFILERDETVAYVNAAAARLYGHDGGTFVGRLLTIIDSGLQAPGFFDALYAGVRAGKAWSGPVVNRHRNGSLVEVELSVTPTFDSEGRLTGLVENHRDVTARQAAQRERERLVTAIEQAADPIWILEPDGSIAYANGAVTRLYGYERAELIGRDPAILDGDEPTQVTREVWASVVAGQKWTGSLVNRCKDGTLVQIESTISPVVDAAGATTAIIATDRDVTRERALEGDLERQARERGSIEVALRRIDPSATPEEIAAAACAEIVQLGGVGSAAVIDLTPGAERVLGAVGIISLLMPAGAAIPAAVAADLRARAATGPSLDDARLYPVDPVATATDVGAGLHSVAFAPFSSFGGTIGIVGIGSHDRVSATRLVERLPALVTFASLLGATLGPGLDARHRGTEAQALVRANLDASAFTSLFQPIVELESRRIVGFEALTRFSGHQGPTLAFAAAARAGLSVELESATLEGALLAARVLPAGAYLSLNASPEFIISGALGSLLEGCTRSLVLEITEHEPITDYVVLRTALRSLPPGVRLAVDDAGAGFASFRHILELDPDFVKLDIGLVRNVDTDPARKALVAGMAFFAAERKLSLVAEGIETAGELETLIRLGVHLGQGYLLGRPKPHR